MPVTQIHQYCCMKECEGVDLQSWVPASRTQLISIFMLNLQSSDHQHCNHSEIVEQPSSTNVMYLCWVAQEILIQVLEHYTLEVCMAYMQVDKRASTLCGQTLVLIDNLHVHSGIFLNLLMHHVQNKASNLLQPIHLHAMTRNMKVWIDFHESD